MRSPRIRPSGGRPALVLACLALALGQVPAVDLDGLTLKDPVEAAIPWALPEAYVPVNVLVDAPQALAVTVRAEWAGSSTSDSWHHPGGRVWRTVLLPPRVGYGQGQLDWRFDDGRSGSVLLHSRLSVDGLALLLVGEESTGLAELRQAVAKLATYRHHEPVQPFTDLTQLPRRWQAYSPEVALLLAPRALAGLETEQRQALATWSRGGGRLLCLVPADAAALTAQGAVAQVVKTDAIPRELLPEGQGSAHYYYQENLTTIEPVPGTDQVPALGFSLLAVLFALVVGPLNLGWVLRRGSRSLLLATTPLLSFSACLALLSYNLVAEGVDPQRVVRQVVWLDQARHQAVAWTATTVYAPFGVSAMETGDEDLLLAVRTNPRESARLNLDWSGSGQLASGGWVPARTNRKILRQQHLPCRGRLMLHRTATGYELVNGLGVAITGLVWRESPQASWVAPSVAPGVRVALMRESDQTGQDTPLAQAMQATAGAAGPGAERQLRIAGLAPGWAQASLAEPLAAMDHLHGRDAVEPALLLLTELAAEASP